jgi:hypothetical protein
MKFTAAISAIHAAQAHDPSFAAVLNCPVLAALPGTLAPWSFTTIAHYSHSTADFTDKTTLNGMY